MARQLLFCQTGGADHDHTFDFIDIVAVGGGPSLALQPGMGILSERRSGVGSLDSSYSSSDGTDLTP